MGSQQTGIAKIFLVYVTSGTEPLKFQHSKRLTKYSEHACCPSIINFHRTPVE